MNKPRAALVLAAALCLALAGFAVLALRYEPPHEGWAESASREVLFRDGTGMGRLGADPYKGPWLKAGQIPPLLRWAAVCAEDKRYFMHPGVDPAALLRACFQNLRQGKVISGASTITMQLARLLNPAPRNLASKIDETFHALALEIRLSKEAILAQYLNRAPFGGPIQGLGAAARILFGKHPSRLSAHEAALLMSLPKNPARLLTPSHQKELKKRRDWILKRMADQGVLSPVELERSLAFAAIPDRQGMRTGAPHFLAALARRGGLAQKSFTTPVRTYIDPGLQHRIQKLLAALAARGAGRGMRQSAALVVRNSDRAILAYVGSPDFFAPGCGQVDGVIAKRQPGSALKPFLYALALERGATLADTIRDDEMELAAMGGVFRPMDYDRKTRGAVRLRVALASSLNLPALRLAAGLGPGAFLKQLRRLGFTLPASARHYGMGLALGNGEVSLLALTRAYAALADRGRLKPLRWRKGQKRAKAEQVISPCAAALITHVLADDSARETGFGTGGVLALPFFAAVKTGTSQKHRDNWCVGYTAKYTVGVWVGNFQAEPMPGVSGVSGAAPVWRSIMLDLHQGDNPTMPPWPQGIKKAYINPETGRAGLKDSGPVVEEFFAPGTGPKKDLLKRMVMETAGPIRITSPVDQAVFALDPDLPEKLQRIGITAKAEGRAEDVRWLLDGKPLLQTEGKLNASLRLTPGRHHLVVEAQGSSGVNRSEVCFMVHP